MTMADLCKTDLQKVIKYLTDAATLYDAQQGLRYSSRAWCIRQLIVKLKKRQNQITTI
jgi:hypothetical protein|nr:MAG TPA: hypothetical protein [Caudoviricetes sp.]